LRTRGQIAGKIAARFARADSILPTLAAAGSSSCRRANGENRIVITESSNPHKIKAAHESAACLVEANGRHLMAALGHTATVFDSELQALSRSIAEMGGVVERQIVEAIGALSNRDRERARRVVAADATIDAMQRTIEESAVETIARRQPVAVDLRQVVGILRIANELERIGDLAKNIGKRVEVINREYMPRRPMGGMRHMTTLMLGQLRDVLDSFANRDVAKAVDVWTSDQDIDRLYTSLFRELLTYMIEDPATVNFGVHLVFCAKNIERMGDHATNIAEAVYYMVKGHTLWRERPKADITPAVAVAMST
jgi:phosphate transport system protein